MSTTIDAIGQTNAKSQIKSCRGLYFSVLSPKKVKELEITQLSVIAHKQTHPTIHS